MGALKFAFGANYKRFYNNIKDIAKKEDKSTFPLLCDAVFCAIALGSGLSDYLNYEFYKKTFNEKKEYATIRNQDNFYTIVSPAEFKKTFTVKPTFMKDFFRLYKERISLSFGINSRRTIVLFKGEFRVLLKSPLTGSVVTVSRKNMPRI